MQINDVLIKWTGSKRLSSSQILQHFPQKINTYYEPFLGGGSILYALLSSNIEVQRIECSDLNAVLIKIFELVKSDPEDLLSFYTSLWPCSHEQYLQIRSEFNKDQDPRKFFYLTRTCRNGLIRFNSKGAFNVAFHQGRSGMTPKKLRSTILNWHHKLKNVHLFVRDYQSITSVEGDFIYLDPPYPATTPFYHNKMDYDLLWSWLSKQSHYALSMNGIEVPEYLYDEKYHIMSGFHRINRDQKTLIVDGLYVKTHK
jgi:DNA adenine methylase